MSFRLSVKSSMAIRLTVLWGLVAIITFVIVKVVKIGPIIATLDAERGWGIHSGDFLFLIPVVIATVLSVKWLRR